MPVSVDISGWLEEVLRHLVEAGIYPSIAEAVRDAVRRFIEKLDLRELALKIYVNGKSSLSYAAYVARESFENMITYILEKGYFPELGSDDKEDVDNGVKVLKDNKDVILDISSLYTLYSTGLIDKLPSSFKMYIPSSLIYDLRRFELRRLIYGSKPVRSFNIISSRIPSQYRRRSEVLLTSSDLESIACALNNSLVLVSDDMRIRRLCKAIGIKSCSSISILYLMLSNGDISEELFEEFKYRFLSIPLIVP